MTNIDDIIKKLSKPQRWFLKYGFFMNPEGCWQLERALVRKGLKHSFGKLTELGEQIRTKLKEKEND